MTGAGVPGRRSRARGAHAPGGASAQPTRMRRRHMTGVLIVGYGNALRGDDGVGWHAAARLAGDPRLAGAEVLARHQLTPELATDVARASLVVLVDARADGGAPGSVSVRRLQPPHDAAPGWSHHLDPAALAGLAGVLYGAVPPVVLVSVGVASLAGGDRLSPAVRRALPGVVEAVARVVEERRDA
jgi:hydrogenase maturation protease